LLFEDVLSDLGAAARFFVHFCFVCFHRFLCAEGLATTLIVFFLCTTGHLTISPTFVSTMFPTRDISLYTHVYEAPQYLEVRDVEGDGFSGWLGMFRYCIDHHSSIVFLRIPNSSRISFLFQLFCKALHPASFLPSCGSQLNRFLSSKPSTCSTGHS